MREAEIRARAAKFADQAETAMGKLGDEVRAEIEELADQVAASAEQTYRQARRRVRGGARAVADSVEERPLTSVVAVGLLCGALGFLLARR